MNVNELSEFSKNALKEIIINIDLIIEGKSDKDCMEIVMILLPGILAYYSEHVSCTPRSLFFDKINELSKKMAGLSD